MSCDTCDTCPAPVLLAPRAYRVISTRAANLAQRLDLAAAAGDWSQVARVVSGLAALQLDMHLCRVGECPCPGRKGALLEVTA